MSSRSALRLIVACLALAAGGQVFASDSLLRIGFLLNFSRFTEWPESGETDKPLIFCIAPGDLRMSGEISALDGQIVRNRPVKTMSISRPVELTRCNVLYLPVDLPGAASIWLANAERTSVLTVSDRPEFLAEGGIINLVLVSGQYRFDVNLALAKRGKLELDANLLRLARSVK